MEENKNITAEEFYKQFEELGKLEKDLGKKEMIQHVLTGLKNTPNERDPGKYGDAFYFVAEITSEDIIKSDSPSLYRQCPECKINRPVLMAYAQTEDSPFGDTWEKEAFIFCKEGVHKLAHAMRGHRF